MATRKKVFNEASKSKISELYVDKQAIIDRKAIVKVFDKDVTFDQVIANIKTQPFIATVQKNILIETDTLDCHKGAPSFLEDISKLPKCRETAVVEVIEVTKFPEINFSHSNMVSMPGKKPKFAAPRLTINLSDHEIDEHVGVRINTGLIVKINPVVMGKDVVKGKIVDTRIGTQPQFVIIPVVVSQHENIIQSIYARDTDDTGLLTINFTTIKKVKFTSPLQITLYAFTVSTSNNHESLITNGGENDENGEGLFKPKDLNGYRWVRNPRIKFLTTSADFTQDPNAVVFDIFDNTKTSIEPIPNKHLKISNCITFFLNRKREWCDPNVIATPLVFNPTNSKTMAKQHPEMSVCPGSVFRTNTHSIVIVCERLTLFSVPGRFNVDCRILNGAFYDLENYTDLNSCVRKARAALNSLSQGAMICEDLCQKDPTMEFEKIMKIYDYDRTLPTPLSKLIRKLSCTDEELFDLADLHCYSVVLRKSLYALAYHSCSDLFTPEQLDELKTTLEAKKLRKLARKEAEKSAAAEKQNGGSVDVEEPENNKRPIDDDIEEGSAVDGGDTKRIKA